MYIVFWIHVTEIAHKNHRSSEVDRLLDSEFSDIDLLATEE